MSKEPNPTDRSPFYKAGKGNVLNYFKTDHPNSPSITSPKRSKRLMTKVTRNDKLKDYMQRKKVKISDDKGRTTKTIVENTKAKVDMSTPSFAVQPKTNKMFELVFSPGNGRKTKRPSQRENVPPPTSNSSTSAAPSVERGDPDALSLELESGLKAMQDEHLSTQRVCPLPSVPPTPPSLTPWMDLVYRLSLTRMTNSSIWRRRMNSSPTCWTLWRLDVSQS
jgi:hypothetical protein